MSDWIGLAADGLLLAGALGATGYCIVLSRRLRRFNDLETGVGGAIALLSAQVDDMTKTLENARKVAASSVVSLDGMTDRAESASRRLEILMASLHDLPEERSAGQAAARGAPRPEAGAEAVSLFQSQRHRAAGGQK